MANAATNRKPVSSLNATILRLPKNPATKVSSFGREFHSRGRGALRFSLLVRVSVLKKKAKPRDCSDNDEISCGEISLCGLELDAEKPTLTFHEKEKKVVQLSDEEGPLGDSVSKDSNFKEVQVDEALVEVSHETFLPLTKEEEAEVRNAFSVRKRMKVLASHKNSNIVITGETLQCLKPCDWLNDEVINLYLDLLKERETREPHKYLKCHFCSTFFYTKLAGGSGYNYEAVRRWTTQSKLGYNLIDCDIIFVPIHGGLHWTLAVINIRECKFQYLDSLEGFDPRILKSLAKYLVDEVKDKSGKNIDVSLWDMEHVKDLPRQQNGYDCGMFMLKYIDFYSRGLKLCFSQKDMPYFRIRTAKEILRLRAH